MTSQMIAMYRMGRTRLTNQLPGMQESDLTRKLHPESNSIGFLLRHIGEVEQLFAKNVFGLSVKVVASTIGKEIRDTGRFTALQPELDHLKQSQEVLEKAIESVPDNAWNDTITTAEFGSVTKAEALSRIISHTGYHAGQIGLIKKYGS